MRLSGNQQHPQAIPNGVDANQGAVVGGRDFSIYVGNSHLKHVGARMIKRRDDFQSFVRPHGKLLHSATVGPQACRDGRACLEACVFGPQAQGDGFIH